MKNSRFAILNKGAIGFLICVSLFSPALDAHAVEYGGFGGRPAFPRPDNPRTESIFIHTLTPGQVQDEGVLVLNNTAEVKTMLVYAADSTPSTGGAFACKQFSEAKTDVGAWISLTKTQVTLEPGTNELVPFAIAVPQDASVGEHNGCILIQELQENTPEQAGASLSVRTGLRVAVTVPGKIQRNLEFAGFKISSQKHGKLLQPLVKNTGNVSIDADVKITTRYFFGLTHTEHGGQYPILRGETSEWNFELPNPFWGGLYKSSFVINYDANPEATVGMTSGKTMTKLVGPTLWFFSVPTLPAIIIELAVLAAIVWSLILFALAIKRKRWITATWVTYTVKKSDDIRSLANRSNVSWKLIAKVNGIKPPYTVTAGEKLRVPPKD